MVLKPPLTSLLPRTYCNVLLCKQNITVWGTSSSNSNDSYSCSRSESEVIAVLSLALEALSSDSQSLSFPLLSEQDESEAIEDMIL